MDPFSALSLAGNVIQFVDFGGRLLANARELYKSPVGSLAVHDAIILITTDLETLVKKLRQSMCESLSSEENENQWQILRKICDEAATVAEELLKRLRTLKLNCKHRTWGSVELAIRSIWNEKEIASLSDRLATLKEALKTRVLFSLRESLDLQSIQTSARFNSLDQQTQHILSAILQFHNGVAGQISRQIREEITGITVTVSQILSRLDAAGQGAHDVHLQTRCALLEEICKRENIQYHKSQEVIAGIEMLSVSKVAEQQLRDRVQMVMLRSLAYNEMTSRYEDVDEAHPETFEWVFNAPAEQQSWSDLSGWLTEGDGVYWVSGKAGSGKSTFMKHLVDDQRKRLPKLFRVWARESPLCIATFFFWNSGTRLQKSQIGFLRALLFQVLNKYPGLIPTAFPRDWSTLYSRGIGVVSDGTDALPLSSRLSWKLTELKEALRALSKQAAMPLKICFVVDGLDEFDGDDGDYESMGAFFKEITESKRVKVFLSSRPWIVFEDLFNSYPNLKLQNLIYPDIEKYVHDKFYLNNAFLKLVGREPAAAPELLKEIVEKADGVFLWVKLVVQSLLNGIRNRDDLVDLSERLRRLPRELKPLYNRLFELIEPYERWASQAIQILRCNRELCNASFEGPLRINLSVALITISEFSLAMSENVQISSIESMRRKDFQVKCEDTEVRLTARCAGFLEVSKIPGTSYMGPGSLINYFHRTAKDFLESDDVWAKLLSATEKTNFNPNVALMRAHLWNIKVQITFSAELAESFIHNDVEASPQVVGFLAYAVRADVHTPSRETQTALIDQLNDLICKYDMEGYWLYDLTPHINRRYKLLEMTTLLGLEGYVRDKLKMQNESQLKATTTSLLQLILSETCGVDGLLFCDVKMLSLLLEGVGSCHPSLLDTLREAQHRLVRLQRQKRAEIYSQSRLDCVQKLYTRIEEFLSDQRPLPAMQSSILKRPAEVIEDPDTPTHSTKFRKEVYNRV